MKYSLSATLLQVNVYGMIFFLFCRQNFIMSLRIHKERDTQYPDPNFQLWFFYVSHKYTLFGIQGVYVPQQNRTSIM